MLEAKAAVCSAFRGGSLPGANILDLKDLSDYVSLSKSAVDLLKSAYSVLPSGERREEIETKVRQAEGLMQRSDAQLAVQLGYYLCRCTWPPQIMLRDHAKKVSYCPRPECGRVDGPPQSQPPTQADFF